MGILSKLEVVGSSIFPMILGIFTKKQPVAEQSTLTTSATLSPKRVRVIRSLKADKACKRFCFWPVFVIVLLSNALCQGNEIFVQHMPDPYHYYQAYSNLESTKSVTKSYIVDVVFQFEEDTAWVNYLNFYLCFTHTLMGVNGKLVVVTDAYTQTDLDDKNKNVYCYTGEALKSASVLLEIEPKTWAMRFFSITGEMPKLHFKATEFWWDENCPTLTCLVHPMPGFAPSERFEQLPDRVLPDARQDQKYLGIFQTIFYPESSSATSRSSFLQSCGSADFDQIPSSPAMYIEKVENSQLIRCAVISDRFFRKACNLWNIKKWVQFFEIARNDQALKNGTANSLPTDGSSFSYHGDNEEYVVEEFTTTHTTEHFRKTTSRPSNLSGAYGGADASVTSKGSAGARPKDRKKTGNPDGKNDFPDIYLSSPAYHYPDYGGIDRHFLAMHTNDCLLKPQNYSTGTGSLSDRGEFTRQQPTNFNPFAGHGHAVNENDYRSFPTRQTRPLPNPCNVKVGATSAEGECAAGTGAGTCLTPVDPSAGSFNTGNMRSLPPDRECLNNPALPVAMRDVAPEVKDDGKQQGQREATSEGAGTHSSEGSLAAAPPWTTHNASDSSLIALDKKVSEACALVASVEQKRGVWERRYHTTQPTPSRFNIVSPSTTPNVPDNSLMALEKTVSEACALIDHVLDRRRDQEERRQAELIRNAELKLKRMQANKTWLCQHYRRCCYLKFPCCNKFYPCHRCHNHANRSDNKMITCTKEAKASHTTVMRCSLCQNEQQVDENAGVCGKCELRMADYFCSICKHYTCTDNNPFHCDKCGICRIHKDRSFHCDVCNVCLDKRLLGKHKCRPNSGHDECCICLEDVFSGCQILPCSHKVHRECAIAMIQNNVQHCPICRHPLFLQGSGADRTNNRTNR